ncbi:MAG: polyphosphate polymerase domain-containing protein [Pseudomonadales bacterium]|nr:polyphosphate polymerase domain-containing protein [Pseudomonadales bacterium]
MTTSIAANNAGRKTDKTAYQLEFSRYEFKYLLDTRLRQQLEVELRHFLDYDPFVAEREDHRYMVRSLYFDDASHTNFHDKIDGLKSRSKFRIRTYTDVPDTDVPQFLELKGRHNNRVYKHRIPLPEPVSLTTTEPVIRRLASEPDATDTGQQFAYETFRKGIAPVALIDYWRRPFVSRYDPDFRVTFDDELHGTETRVLFPARTARRIRLLPGFTVMEVKFGYHLPAWFHRLIQSYELRRVSVSKICEGMSALGLATDLQ